SSDVCSSDLDAPNIYFFRFKIILLINLQSLDIIGKHSSDIGPAKASTNKIETIVSFKIIDNGMLVHSIRVTARCSCLIHIRNARNSSPHAPCSTITGRKASIKEYSLPAQTVEKRRGIKFVSVSRCFICAEGLANYEHHVTGLFRPFCYSNPAGKIKVNRVGLVDAQVLYHQRIGCLNFLLIKS